MDVLNLLQKRQGKRSQKELAIELGVSPQYLSDVLNERKEPGSGILDPLGLERVVTYRRKR